MPKSAHGFQYGQNNVFLSLSAELTLEKGTNNWKNIEPIIIELLIVVYVVSYTIWNNCCWQREKDKKKQQV